MIVLVNERILGVKVIQDWECLSTDNIDDALPTNPTQNIGSTMFVVDTKEVYKLNHDSNQLPKWYLV